MSHGRSGTMAWLKTRITVQDITDVVEQAVEIRKAVDFPFTVDLPVRMPQHIAERIAMGDVFLREILSKGIVLYAE
jgi:hypothetical protein